MKFSFLSEQNKDFLSNIVRWTIKKSRSVFGRPTPGGEEIVNATTHQTPNPCFITMHPIFYVETNQAVEKRTKNLYRIFHIRKIDALALRPFIERLNRCVKRFMDDQRVFTAIEGNAIEAMHYLIKFAMAHRERPIGLGHASEPLLLILRGTPCCFEGESKETKAFAVEFEQNGLFADKVLIDHRGAILDDLSDFANGDGLPSLMQGNLTRCCEDALSDVLFLSFSSLLNPHDSPRKSIV